MEVNRYTRHARAFGWAGMPVYVVDGKVFFNSRCRGDGQDWFEFMDEVRDGRTN